MADIADHASEVELLRITAALASRNKSTLPFIGACHNCDERLERGSFCDSDCRDDWEKEQKLKLQRVYS